MKKLLLLVLCSLSFFVKAQTSVYHPFPDSNATWNIHFHGIDMLMTFATDEYYSITLSGDTIIHSQSYHKLIIPYIHIPTNGNCQYFFFPYAGALRQDTANKKVYYFPPSDTAESMLYDFNMQVGDSIKGFFESLYSGIIITSVDSIFIGNNYRKQWNMNGPPWQIIEGIGSTYSLCEIPQPTSVTNCYEEFSLTCFVQNIVTIYPDTLTLCQLINNIENPTPAMFTTNVQPNPFHSLSVFSTLTIINDAEFTLYNSLGIVMRRKKILNNTFLIDRVGLSNGVYFYKLISNDGLISIGKIVIE